MNNKLEGIEEEQVTRIKNQLQSGVGNGKIISLHWFEGSVTENTFLNILKENVWPALKGSATGKRLWFLQECIQQTLV